MNGNTGLSRRLFLRACAGWGALGLSAVALEACGGAPASGSAGSPAAKPAIASPAGTSGTGAGSPAPSAGAAGPASGQAGSASVQAASPASAQPAASGLRKVSYGELRILGDAGVYVGMEQGFFAKQGIDIQLVGFDTGVNMIPPLGTGQLDVGGGATSAGLLNAINRGVALKAVADKGHISPTPPGFPVADLLVRKDLWDSGKVRSAKDLKGLTIATPAKGFSGELTAAKELAKGGLKPTDVNFVNVPLTEIATAFANKKIDAGGAIEPFRTIIVDVQKTGVTLMHDYDVESDGQTAVILYGPSFAQSPLAVPFITAYLQGVRMYNDGFVKKDPAARQKAIDAMIKHTAVKDRSLYDKMTIQGLDPNGKINVASLQEQQDYWLAHGEQQKKVDLSSVIDDQFVKAAVAELGTYAL